jgi:hypothetical protein
LVYNISYSFHGDVKGRFLLIIPYRTCFEVSGSADFGVSINNLNQYEFSFIRLTKPGYLFRSLGIRARQFVIVAAYHDMDELLKFLVEKLNKLQGDNPDHTEYINNARKLLVEFPVPQLGAIRFLRELPGIHNRFYFDLELCPTFNREQIKIDFNVYRIMVEFLRIFNHSYLPEGTDRFYVGQKNKWKSQWLDISEYVNQAAWKVASFLKRFVKFKQKKPFRLNYYWHEIEKDLVEIYGEAHPNIRIWGRFNITAFCRKIRIRKSDSLLIEDAISLEIRNQKGMGGEARIILKLAEEEIIR